MQFADDPTYACAQCLDDPAGWMLLRCTGRICARTKPHASHLFAVRCPCWLKRHADVIRRQAEGAMANGSDVPRLFHDLTDLMQGRYVWAHSVTVDRSEHRAPVDHFAEQGR